MSILFSRIQVAALFWVANLLVSSLGQSMEHEVDLDGSLVKLRRDACAAGRDQNFQSESLRRKGGKGSGENSNLNGSFQLQTEVVGTSCKPKC